MRIPTPEDIKKWATTPITIQTNIVVDSDGQPLTEHIWQRMEKKGQVVEVLEGSTTRYILERITTRTLKLIGVE